ncbi:methyltransferase domain-containing protein [Rhizobium sp. HT1-10]|uniref:class I SAM-dependent methyltransferase n=1 Tax=Rhizobium sp. HT1-10 TaxID=3111638 RepID=UPI003C1B4660
MSSDNKIYQHKFRDVVDIISDWYEPYGGVSGKDMLEFGCGEGTVALGMALRKTPRRVVGVEILDVVNNCEDIARDHFGLQGLPTNLRLQQISPGQDLRDLGMFDFIYCWSVFEHVKRDLLEAAFRTIAEALKPEGVLFLQISPLYYSRDGSHLAPWVGQPWAHLAMEHDEYRQALYNAPPTPQNLREAWSVYIPLDAPQSVERDALWETYTTLNKVTAPQLKRAAASAGLEVVRDYRTKFDDPIPLDLAEIYDEDVLRTEQVVWLLRHETLQNGEVEASRASLEDQAY